jgi:hypothetical protein
MVVTHWAFISFTELINANLFKCLFLIILKCVIIKIRQEKRKF